MIDRGIWLPDESKSDWEIFKFHSNWIVRMWDFCESSLLTECGVFNPKENKQGLVRDHMLSKRDAFDLGLFPEIIRHPENCQFLTHTKNAKKWKYSSHDVHILFDKIRNIQYSWIEQEKVLYLIQQWENGERFLSDNYRRKSNE